MGLFRRKKTLGLALGGGAARGFAHIGALKALDDAGISPQFVAGTSVGSLVGALYCAGRRWSEILAKAEGMDWRDLVTLTFPRLGVVKPEGLRDLLEELVGQRSVEELPIPFAAVAVDLVSAREVVLDSGPVSRAVLASCSIPGVFVPVLEEDSVLVDGGVLNAVPADVVRRMGAEFVIAVDLNADVRGAGGHPENILDVLVRSMAVFMKATSGKGLDHADCTVQPDLKGFSYHDMARGRELFERGERAMREALEHVGGRLG